MKNKKLIIVLIVVAVAAFLLWRRSKASEEDPTVVNDDSGSAADHTSLDYILSHITFNSQERQKIESVRQAMETATTWRQKIAADAYKNGLSFDQQLVLDALWLLYIDPTTGTDTSGGRRWKLESEVKNL